MAQIWKIPLLMIADCGVPEIRNLSMATSGPHWDIPGRPTVAQLKRIANTTSQKSKKEKSPISLKSK